jgi:hypothetical protein
VLPTTDEDNAQQARTRRSDSMLALLAALATLAFAWSGYQSAEWVRDRFHHSDDAASLSEQAVKVSAEADRLEERDTILFVEWLIALDAGQPETAHTVFQLFRPQLQSYLTDAPADAEGKPEVPPFDSARYDVAQMHAEANDLEATARAESRKSRSASENGARYGALGVLFAGVLAVVGIATRFVERRVRLGLIVLATSLIVLGLALLVASPVSFSA